MDIKKFIGSNIIIVVCYVNFIIDYFLLYCLVFMYGLDKMLLLLQDEKNCNECLW